MLFHLADHSILLHPYIEMSPNHILLYYALIALEIQLNVNDKLYCEVTTPKLHGFQTSTNFIWLLITWVKVHGDRLI